MKSNIDSRQILMIARSVAIALAFILILAWVNPLLVLVYLLGAGWLGYHWVTTDQYRPRRFASKHAQQVYEAKHYALALIVIPAMPIGFVVSRLAKLALKAKVVR